MMRAREKCKDQRCELGVISSFLYNGESIEGSVTTDSKIRTVARTRKKNAWRERAKMKFGWKD